MLAFAPKARHAVDIEVGVGHDVVAVRVVTYSSAGMLVGSMARGTDN